MSKRRLLLVHAVIALLICGSLYDIITGSEHWPFSPYPMYSGVQRERSLSSQWLFGVVEEEPYREIPIRGYQYIQPFDQTRLTLALIRARGNSNKQLLNQALRDCLVRYERLRLAGLHDGPPLRGLKIYELEWKLDPKASNLNEPYRRTLLAEFRRSEGEP